MSPPIKVAVIDDDAAMRKALVRLINDEALLAAIHRAAERSRALKAARDELIAVKRRYERMTPRERQVFALVASGFLNKQIAFDLGVAERTVKVHRARVMEKMEADSLAQVSTHGSAIGCSHGRGTSLSYALRAC